MFRKIINIIPYVFFVIFPAHLLADEAKSDGGIEVFNPNNGDYWFKLHGIIQVDATIFSGGHEDKQTDFPSGTNVRGLELDLEGGIGHDLSYSIALALDNGVGVNDAYFTYHAYDHLDVSLGQVISPFCLENTNSGKWLPFLERSLPVVAFRPCLGIGGRIQNWGDDYSFALAVTTPLHGTNKDKTVSGTSIMHRSDRLTTTGRLTFAPILTDEQVIQIGGSAVYGDTNTQFRDGSPNVDGRRFSTPPEAKARNTFSLVNSGNNLLVRHYSVLGAEAGGLFGHLLLQAEYLHTFLTRDDLPHAQFHGWYAQGAYVLTGEMREYKAKDGKFGAVKPRCWYGAWEVGARFSTVNLNDKDILGGKEHNTTLGLNWFFNKNLRISGDYIFASITPSQALSLPSLTFLPNKRHLHIVGLRTQVVW
ncbi:MAG TPA: porin [Gammaproteobacteria bacterium]|nr:porin [Gammaproteobacteria bacterium]